MRLTLFGNGMIDDLVYEASRFRLQRTGEARYLAELRGEEDMDIELWTTRKGQIQFGFLDEESPVWVELDQDNGALQYLRCDACTVHIEHCDRSLYSFVVSRDIERYGGSILASGYLKTRLVSRN